MLVMASCYFPASECFPTQPMLSLKSEEPAEIVLCKVGKKVYMYNLLFWNCEHFAKSYKYNVPISEQIENKVADLVLGSTDTGAAMIAWRYNWANSWRPSSCE